MRTSTHVISGGSMSCCQNRAISSPVWWACSSVTCISASRSACGRFFHHAWTGRSRSLSCNDARRACSFAITFSMYARTLAIVGSVSRSPS
ncbi:MAG TPA: hypothetical protein VF992_11570 [Thermoplasmata archaeon]